jgi:hypothetical protein
MKLETQISIYLDFKKIQILQRRNKRKVFSCFACGGGSTMEF